MLILSPATRINITFSNKSLPAKHYLFLFLFPLIPDSDSFIPGAGHILSPLSYVDDIPNGIRVTNIGLHQSVFLTVKHSVIKVC